MKKILAIVFCAGVLLSLCACGSALKKAQVGDCISFGAFEQDDDAANGKEPVEWLVLAREDDRLLVISRYALDARPFHTDRAEVAWEECSLRRWLNESFFSGAFSASEQAMIPAVTIPAGENPDYGTDPGAETTDRVFLLSIAQAAAYFPDEAARLCEPTAYALSQGSAVSTGGLCWGWWLRSPGNNPYNAALVLHDGSLDARGATVNYGDYSVRPAMWIEIG